MTEKNKDESTACTHSALHSAVRHFLLYFCWLPRYKSSNLSFKSSSFQIVSWQEINLDSRVSVDKCIILERIDLVWEKIFSVDKKLILLDSDLISIAQKILNLNIMCINSEWIGVNLIWFLFLKRITQSHFRIVMELRKA